LQVGAGRPRAGCGGIISAGNKKAAIAAFPSLHAAGGHPPQGIPSIAMLAAYIGTGGSFFALAWSTDSFR
jgi:hypothetical protein